MFDNPPLPDGQDRTGQNALIPQFTVLPHPGQTTLPQIEHQQPSLQSLNHPQTPGPSIARYPIPQYYPQPPDVQNWGQPQGSQNPTPAPMIQNYASPQNWEQPPIGQIGQTHYQGPQSYAAQSQVPFNYPQAPQQSHPQYGLSVPQPRLLGQATQQGLSHASVQRARQYGRAVPVQNLPEGFAQAHPKHGKRSDPDPYGRIPPAGHPLFSGKSTVPPYGAPNGPPSQPYNSNSRAGPTQQTNYTPRTPYSQYGTDSIVRPSSSISQFAAGTDATTSQSVTTMRTQLVPASRGKHYEDRRIGGDDFEHEEEYSLNNYQNADRSRRLGHSVHSAIFYPARQQPSLRTESMAGSQDIRTLVRRDSTDTVLGPVRQTPYSLAQAIMRGETEDPSQTRAMELKYTTPSKLVLPVMGPHLRFDTSKFFSSIDERPAETSNKLVRTGLKVTHDIENPDWLSTVQQGLCIATVDELMDDLPITEVYRMVAPSTAGVLKITDIPYQATRTEVVACLGKRARILCLPEATTYPAIHILMERETGKTMYCYVELATKEEVYMLLASHKRRVQAGRPTKLGDRPIDMAASSQAELLADLFPRAKHVKWRGAQPTVDMTPRMYVPGQLAVGFQGFIHPEEFHMVLRHAELGEKSPYASKSLSRPYETMISVLHKYPWYTPKYVPTSERARLFKWLIVLMVTLMDRIRWKGGKPGLGSWSPALLQEMVIAALVCPGFTEVQKAGVIECIEKNNYGYMVHNAPSNVRLGGNHAFAPYWPFSSLSVKPGTDVALLQYYAHVFHQATLNAPGHVPWGPAPMGRITFDYNGSPNPSNLTLSTAAKIEYAKIKELVHEFVRVSPPPTGYAPMLFYPIAPSAAGLPAPAGVDDVTPLPRPESTRESGSRSATPTRESMRGSHNSIKCDADSSNGQAYSTTMGDVQSRRNHNLSLYTPGRARALTLTEILDHNSATRPAPPRGETTQHRRSNAIDLQRGPPPEAAVHQRVRGHNMVPPYAVFDIQFDGAQPIVTPHRGSSQAEYPPPPKNNTDDPWTRRNGPNIVDNAFRSNFAW